MAGFNGGVLQRHTRIAQKLSGEGDGIKLAVLVLFQSLTFEPEGP